MAAGGTRAEVLDELRHRVARLERRGVGPAGGIVPFGIAAIDAALPGGGLGRGALHEVAGRGADVEHGAAAALLIAGVLARLQGPVLWVCTQRGFCQDSCQHGRSAGDRERARG